MARARTFPRRGSVVNNAGMSHLTLVRHGQATFPYQEKDRLTKIGRSQARLLGSFWASRRLEFDQVYCGPGGRHRETALLVGRALLERGIRWPQPIVLDSLDEYQAGAILNLGMARLREVDRRLGDLWRAWESATDPDGKDRAWNRLFEVILQVWARREVELEGVEPWQQFCTRVESGLSEIVSNGGKGRVVAVFTSGGPIAVAARRALETSIENTLKMAWMVRNASLTEFLFSGNRFTLSTFNTFPHLRHPSVLTYR